MRLARQANSIVALRDLDRRALATLVALTVGVAYVPAAAAAEPPAEDTAVGGDEGDAPAEDDAGDEDADAGEDAPDGEEADTDGDEASEGEDGEDGEDGEEEADGEAGDEEAADEEAEEAEEAEEVEAEAEEETEEEVQETPAPPEPVAAPEPEDERGPPPMYGEREANGKGLLIAGGVVTAGGLAFLGASIAVTRCDPNRPNCPYGDDDLFLIPSAIAVTGVGAMLLVAGGINMARYKKWQRGELKTTYVAPSMLRGGAGVTAVGRF